LEIVVDGHTRILNEGKSILFYSPLPLLARQGQLDHGSWKQQRAGWALLLLARLLQYYVGGVSGFFKMMVA